MIMKSKSICSRNRPLPHSYNHWSARLLLALLVPYLFAMVSTALACDFGDFALSLAELGKHTTPATLPPVESWLATTRDQMTTTREFYESVTNAATGEVSPKVHRVIEVASGLNYREADGAWAPSQSLLESTPDGGCAGLHGVHRLRLQPNLNLPGAVSIQAGDQVLQTRILGLFYVDRRSGQVVCLSRVRDCSGQVQGENTAVYRSVLESIEASVRYTYSKSGFESDLILQEAPPPPEAFGLPNDSSKLEVWHEFVTDAVPRKTFETIKSEPDPIVRAASAEPDMVDESLRFGNLWFPLGRAFTLDDANATSASEPAKVRIRSEGAKVCKTWTSIDGRQILIEALDWAEIQKELAKLPPAAMLDTWSVLPERHVPEALPRAQEDERQMGMAPEYSKPTGFCIDYVYVTTGTDMEFATGQTYYVSGWAAFDGQLTFRPNSIIKYNADACIASDGGAIQCSTTGSPTIFTSKDDPRFGETVGTSCVGQAASLALAAYYIEGNVALSNLRICYADTAVYLTGGARYYPNTISGCTFESCDQGVHPAMGGNDLSISASTAIDVLNPVVWDTQGDPTVYGTFTVKQSLWDHIVKGTQALTTQRNANNWVPQVDNWGREIFGYGTNINPWSWVYNIQGFNGMGYRTSDGVGCALVTDRHAIAAWHTAGVSVAGTWFKFVGRDNVVYDRECQGAEHVSFDYDVVVLAFDPPLPSYVDVLKILPPTAAQKLPLSFKPSIPETCYAKKVPAIAPTKELCRMTHALDVVGLDSANGTLSYTVDHTSGAPDWWQWIKCASLEAWERWTILGDCGHPVWFLVNNGAGRELVFVGTYHGGAGPNDPTPLTTHGPWTGNFQSEVQSAISSLHSSTGVEVRNPILYDLSAFPDLD